MPLGEARRWLRERTTQGAPCPCCTQFAKVYLRPITSTMARDAVVIVRDAGREWFHMPTVLGHNTGDTAKLANWGFLEEDNRTRDDGGRAGWWRITDGLEQFVRHGLAVPKYARIYDGRSLGLTGDPVTIVDCLRERFDLAELLATPGGPAPI